MIRTGLAIIVLVILITSVVVDIVGRHQDGPNAAPLAKRSCDWDLTRAEIAEADAAVLRAMLVSTLDNLEFVLQQRDEAVRMCGGRS